MVVGPEFAQFQAFAEFSLEFQTPHRALMHRGIEDFAARLPCSLGTIHGDTRVAQQVFRMGAGRRAKGNSHAGVHHDFVSLHGEGNGQLGLQSLRHPNRIAGASDIFQKDGVFIATEPGQRVVLHRAQLRPGDRVHFAQRCSQSLTDLNQNFVTDFVSQAVVKNLEFIDINKQDSEFVFGVALGEHQGALQPVEKKGAVGKIGQSVVERVMRQQLFRALALGDIAVHDHQLFGFPFGIANSAGRRLQDAPGTVLVAYPIFQPFSLTGGAGLVRRFQHALTVIGMNLVNR